MIEPGIHIICGSLGDGKTLRAVQILEWFVKNNRRVATNVNLNIERLLPLHTDKVDIHRIPDKPSVEILKALGPGATKKGHYGLLLLDELGIWMNSRTYADKDRLSIIRFIIELRKRRWIPIFIAQKPSMIDKQVRDIGATVHTCRSTKNILFLKLLPRIHFVSMMNTLRVRAARVQFYRSQHLFNSYDTEQQYCDTYEIDFGGKASDGEGWQWLLPDERKYRSKNGYYSYLPPTRLNKHFHYLAKKATKFRIYRSLSHFAAFAVFLITMAMLIPNLVPSFATEYIQALDFDKESSGSVDQTELILENSYLVTPDTDNLEDGHNPFLDLRIRHFSRIGSNYRYHFERSDGSLLTSDSLEINGYRVENRGRSEALIVSPDYEYWSVYR